MRVSSIKLNEMLDPLLKPAVNEAFAEVRHRIADSETEKSNQYRSLPTNNAIFNHYRFVRRAKYHMEGAAAAGTKNQRVLG